VIAHRPGSPFHQQSYLLAPGPGGAYDLSPAGTGRDRSPATVGTSRATAQPAEDGMTRPRFQRHVAALLACLLLSGAWSRASAQELSLRDHVVERVLDNGLKVLLVVRPRRPSSGASWPTGGVGERAAGHHRDLPLPRAHDVQGHLQPGGEARNARAGPGDHGPDRLGDGSDHRGGIQDQGRDDEKIKGWNARVAELIEEQRRETMVGRSCGEPTRPPEARGSTPPPDRR